jgi:class 3 adenylate cyclase/tetratricopeptide (TPR) repeat protein
MLTVTCHLCDAENRPGAQFCRECGARLEVVCRSCAGPIGPGMKFCDRCGTPVRDAGAAEDGQHRFASPESYTPPHLAEKILKSRQALAGERKHVTVLLADLKGSLELLAERDPEDARQMLDPVLERMMEAVHRFDGTVNQVMGDGIMALFGAPVAHEDHALRACYAALAMQAAVRGDEGGEAPPVAIRVGLNSGEVVVRAIGSDLHMDYTAVGQTTHLAGRMEQLARPGTVLMTAATLRLVEGFVETVSLGPTPIRGLPAPVEVVQLLGTRPARSRLQAMAARGLTRFVGRGTELDQINRAVERAAHGQGQVVAMVGEPGVGKSRLLWEFTHSDICRSWLVLESRSVSYGRTTAYLPLIDLLRAYFQIEDRDHPRKIAEKVTGKVLALDEALEPSLPAFLGLLDVPVDDPQWVVLEPRQRRQRTLEAVKRLLLRESQIQPLLLAFEDLHWIDSETQALLDALVASLPAARVLLLVNYRPGYRHNWANKTYYTQLRVDQLSRASAEELLDVILGPDTGLGPVRDLLIDQAEGNPFFIEESVRTLVETSALIGERGAYRLARAPKSIQVPPTVQAILAARIDRLPPEDKSLLETAAVLGKDVPLALLQAIAGLPLDVLQAGLAHLQAAEFLYETALFPEIEYTFKHALTHEVAYGSLLNERRRALHEQIVAAMESLYADRLGEQVERLATHARRGEVWAKAVPYLRQAGLKATGRSANADAVSWLEQALEAAGRLPAGRPTSELAVDLRFDLRNALFALGDLDRIERTLTQAGRLAEELHDRRRQGWVSAYMSHYFWRVGQLARAVESGERALAVAEAVGDFALQTTNVNVGLAHYGLGDYPRAIECLRRILLAIPKERSHERFGWAGLPAVTARAYLASCLAEQGEFDEALAHVQEAVRIAEEVDHAFSLGQALISLGTLHLRRGDISLAMPAFERGLELSRLADVPALFAGSASGLGYARALAGQVAWGIQLLEQGVAEAAARKITARHSLWVAWLSEACLLAGHHERAAELARQALDLSRTHGTRGNHAVALRVRAEVAAHDPTGDAAATEALYRQAIAEAERLGMRALQAQARLGLGSLYRKTARAEAARAELEGAATMLRAMGMTFWLPRVDVELAAIGAHRRDL